MNLPIDAYKKTCRSCGSIFVCGSDSICHINQNVMAECQKCWDYDICRMDIYNRLGCQGLQARQNIGAMPNDLIISVVKTGMHYSYCPYDRPDFDDLMERYKIESLCTAPPDDAMDRISEREAYKKAKKSARQYIREWNKKYGAGSVNLAAGRVANPCIDCRTRPCQGTGGSYLKQAVLRGFGQKIFE